MLHESVLSRMAAVACHRSRVRHSANVSTKCSSSHITLNMNNMC